MCNYVWTDGRTRELNVKQGVIVETTALLEKDHYARWAGSKPGEARFKIRRCACVLAPPETRSTRGNWRENGREREKRCRSTPECPVGGKTPLAPLTTKSHTASARWSIFATACRTRVANRCKADASSEGAARSRCVADDFHVPVKGLGWKNSGVLPLWWWCVVCTCGDVGRSGAKLIASDGLGAVNNGEGQ